MKKKKSIIIGIVAIFLVVGGIGGYFYNKHHKEVLHKQELKAYKGYLNDFEASAYVAGLSAEKITNRYSSVWHSAIFNYSVTINDVQYRDFNEALAAQYSAFETDGTLDSLNEAFEESNKLYKKMKNPPKEFEEEYSVVSDTFDSLNAFVSIAKNPTGSLQTFNQETNSKDSDFAADLQKLSSLIE